MKVAILGATRGMGRAMARQLAGRGDRVFLLGRDPDELGRSARDLETRAQGTVETAVCDLEDTDTFEPALTAAVEALGGLDAVVITAGMFGTQEDLEADLDRMRRLLTVNFAHTVVFCEVARAHLMRAGGARTLCVFSSVAGDRGRKKVVLYGSSKAGLSRYLEGLDHRFHDQGLRVVTVKPGFVRTGMTAGLPEPPFAGEPDQVASIAIGAMGAGKPVVYAPSIWRWVMLVIRNLPRFVMRKVGF